MPLRLNKASLHQLRIFMAVVENSGFSAAQAQLNMSSATVSVKIKELESHLGMKLCQRGRSGFKLTEEGERAYEAAKTLSAACDNFNLAFSRIGEELVGEVRIGMQDNLATNPNFRLSDAIRNFNRRENSVVFNIEEARGNEQESRTLDDRYHLAIGLFHHRIPGLNYEKLFEETVSLYCAKTHPLFSKPRKAITLSDLEKTRAVSAGPIQGVLHANEILPDPSALAENMDATVLVLLSGNYVGFLPTHYADVWVNRGLLKALLPDTTTRDIEFFMITRKGIQQPHIVNLFIEEIIDCHQATDAALM